MAALIEPLMTGQPAPWLLYMAGVPMLAFALGMYLPMEINTPVLLGGILSWFVQRQRSGEDAEAPQARHQRGILIASGLIAGGALMGVINAALGVGFGTETMERLFVLNEHAFDGLVGEGLALAGVLALCILVVQWSRRAKV